MAGGLNGNGDAVRRADSPARRLLLLGGPAGDLTGDLTTAADDCAAHRRHQRRHCKQGSLGRQAEDRRRLSEAISGAARLYGELGVVRVSDEEVRAALTATAVATASAADRPTATGTATETATASAPDRGFATGTATGTATACDAERHFATGTATACAAGRLSQRLQAKAREQGFRWDFAVHLTTTGAPDDDLRIAHSVPGLLKELGIDKLIYVSSMAVMGPQHVTSHPSVTARLQCEAYYKSLMHQNKLDITVIRPSGLGKPVQGFWRQACLFLLRRIPEAVPRCLNHCHVEPAKVAHAILKVGCDETKGIRVHCVMGPTHPLIVADPPAGIGGWLLEVFVFFWCRLALSIAFGALAKVFLWIHEWMVTPMEPCSEEDIIALCSPHNSYCTQIAGGGSRLRLHRKQLPGKLIVSTRHFKGIVSQTDTTVCARSGTTLGELATLLGGPRSPLLLHPTYSIASIGGAVVVPVHSTGPNRLLVSDCVKSVTYLYKGQVHCAAMEEALQEGFDLILHVTFHLGKLWKTVCVCEEHIRRLPSRLSCAGVVTALDTDRDANVELALLFPQIGSRWRLRSYAVSSARSRVATDARRIRRPSLQWLFARAAILLSHLGAYGIFGSVLASFEVFMEEYDFVQFINELSAFGTRCPLIRVLIRRCCSPAFFGHSRPLYAIDATSLQLETYLAACRALFSKYSSARLHPAKYIGSLAPAVAILGAPLRKQKYKS